MGGRRGAEASERSTREILGWLLGAAGHRGARLVSLLCVLQAASAGLSVTLAPLMQRAVDAATGGQQQAFWGFAAAFALVVCVQVALRAWIRRTLELTRAIVENRLRSRVFADVLGLGAREAEARHSADLMSRMTSDVGVVSDAVSSLLPSVVSMSIRLVGVLAVMALIAPGLAAAFGAVGAFALAVSAGLRRVLRRRHRSVQEAEGNVRTFIQECLESLLVVRVFGAGPKMLARADALMEAHKAARMRKNAVSNLGSTGFSVAIQGGYVLGFLWCGAGMLRGELSYGTLLAVTQLIGQISGPLGGLGGTHARWSSMLASAERLMEVGRPAKRERAAWVPQGEPPQDLGAFYGELTELCLEGVCFSYDDEKPAVSGFSGTLEKGRLTAVVGPSGAGKSTLMRLLLGAYAPDAGRVALAGRGPGGAWSCAPEAAPPGLFAYVPQGNRLMAGTVAEAVALAGEGAPDPALLDEALHAACADGFVAALPDGASTCLGEHGAGLSEGQMQRLAVARAVYSRAPVLLLDEATSALDAATEGEMLGRLRALSGRTIVIVTHRAEAVAFCDGVVHVGEGLAQ